MIIFTSIVLPFTEDVPRLSLNAFMLIILFIPHRSVLPHIDRYEFSLRPQNQQMVDLGFKTLWFRAILTVDCPH